VEDVDDVLTVEVERNRGILAKQSPFLLDYQAEDMARMVTKARGYIGWEVGGGKTCSSIAWANARQYKRVLVVCESRLVENWLAECKKFGVKGYRLTSHAAVANLRERIRRGEKPTGFYITSYEFLALDGSKRFAPWDCVKYDKEGNVRHSAEGITDETCSCGSSYQLTVKECPSCENTEKWSGQHCGACGFIAYTYTGERRQRPAYKAISKLFPCVIADEAQVAKSKLSRRGQALRSLRSKGCLVLTATLFKGYVTDCVPGVTPVLLEDGTTQRIVDVYSAVSKGIPATVVSYNETTGALEPKAVLAARETRRKPLVRVIYEHGGREHELVCSEDHEVLTKRGYVPAGELIEADEILTTMQ
jgi:hypothetical protein